MSRKQANAALDEEALVGTSSAGQSRAGAAEPIAIVAIVISLAALGVSAFAAYQSHLSAVSAIATVRPVLDINVGEVTQSGDMLKIPIKLTNIGKTSASIEFARLIYWQSGDGKYKYYPFETLGQVIVRPGSSTSQASITVERFQVVNGASIDLMKGLDSQRRLGFIIRYAGREMDGTAFEESTSVPVAWP